MEHKKVKKTQFLLLLLKFTQPHQLTHLFMATYVSSLLVFMLSAWQVQYCSGSAFLLAGKEDRG